MYHPDPHPIFRRTSGLLAWSSISRCRTRHIDFRCSACRLSRSPPQRESFQWRTGCASVEAVQGADYSEAGGYVTDEDAPTYRSDLSRHPVSQSGQPL